MRKHVRLAVYLAYAEDWQEDSISSHDLATEAGLHSSQVRRDIGELGKVGMKGVGYNREQLVGLLRPAVRAHRTEINSEATMMGRNAHAALDMVV